MPPKRKPIWLLFDLSNGDRGSKRYCWWFETREDAREHRKYQMRLKFAAELSGPVKFWRAE